MTRNRRWLVTVAVMAAIVLGGAYWSTRPRIDRRLLGVWEITNSEVGFWLRLSDDGSAAVYSPYEPERLRLRWSADGDVLTWRTVGEAEGIEHVREVATMAYEEIASGEIPTPEITKLQIMSIASDELRLREIGNNRGEVAVYRRVSEQEQREAAKILEGVIAELNKSMADQSE